jgi:hypothetical protein
MIVQHQIRDIGKIIAANVVPDNFAPGIPAIVQYNLKDAWQC